VKNTEVEAIINFLVEENEELKKAVEPTANMFQRREKL